MTAFISLLAVPLLIIAALVLVASHLKRPRRGNVEALRGLPYKPNRRRGAA